MHAHFRFVTALFAANLTILGALAASIITHAAEPADHSTLRWYRGNTHTHSFWSDGNDFPEMIADWYKSHGYHFLALSDHNILSEGVRWMPHEEIVKRGGADALAKYVTRFGDEWVETRGAPGAADHEVRLKPLQDFR